MDFKGFLENMKKNIENEAMEHGYLLGEKERDNCKFYGEKMKYNYCYNYDRFIDNYVIDNSEEFEFILFSDDSIYKNILVFLYSYIDDKDNMGSKIYDNATSLIYAIEEIYRRGAWKGYKEFIEENYPDFNLED